MSILSVKLQKSVGLAGICILLAFGLVLVADLIAELFGHAASLFGAHSDWLALYAAGALVLHGHASQLYTASALAPIELAIAHHPVGVLGYMPYLYPPFVAALLAPFSLASPEVSRIIVALVSCGAAALALVLLCKPCPLPQRIVAATLLGCSFPVYHTLAEGQPTLIMLLGCALAAVLAVNKRDLPAGLLLGALWVKPQLALLVLVGVAVGRKWRIAAGMAAALVIAIIVCLPFTGIEAYQAYGSYLLQVATSHAAGAGAVTPAVWEGNFKTMINIEGFYAALVGQYNALLVDSLTAITTVSLVVMYALAAQRIRLKRTTPSKKYLIAVGIGVITLINPHCFVQDAVFLMLAIPFIAPRNPRTLGIAIGAAFLLDELAIDQYLPIHLFSLILFGLVLAVCIGVTEQQPQQPHRLKQAPA